MASCHKRSRAGGADLTACMLYYLRGATGQIWDGVCGLFYSSFMTHTSIFFVFHDEDDFIRISCMHIDPQLISLPSYLPSCQSFYALQGTSQKFGWLLVVTPSVNLRPNRTVATSSDFKVDDLNIVRIFESGGMEVVIFVPLTSTSQLVLVMNKRSTLSF